MCRPLENPVSIGGGLTALPQHGDFGSEMYMLPKQTNLDMQGIHPIPFMNPMVPAYQKPTFEYVIQQPPRTQYDMTPAMPSVEAGSMQDLLDYALFDDDVKMKGDDEVEVSEEFDNKEIDILYTFLMDRSSTSASTPASYPATIPSNPTVDPNVGVISLNLLDDSPLDSYLDTTDEDDIDQLLSIQLVPPAQFQSQVFKRIEDDVSDGSTDHSDKNRRLCKMAGCQRRSRSHGLCISHGGGRRCAVEGCGKSSQGGNLCIKHGGGKRCEKEGCNRAAQSNNLCKAHGGGPRCLFEGCDRSSQGGGYCRSHGGGKRCLFEGCDKGTQRGEFCALHGGSRLCGVSGCMRNDRGGGFCATHGGGKRCSQEGCEKPCRRRGMCSAHIRMLENNSN